MLSARTEVAAWLTSKGLRGCSRQGRARAIVTAGRRMIAVNGTWFERCALTLFLLAVPCLPLRAQPAMASTGPYLIVLGIAQDGGVPQAGSQEHPGWADPRFRRRVASLGLVDRASGQRWMIDATPDFREQLRTLDDMAPVEGTPGLSGIFLTHAHMGHYAGLMHLGHESMGARGVVVHVMPRMQVYLRSNGPWSQLVERGNIVLQTLEEGVPARLTGRLTVTPFTVPHRQEYSEVVGFRIDGPKRSVVYVPDIDSWTEWDTAGRRLEDLIASVDVAYVDGTFYADGEIPGRDMSGFPHPFITVSMERLRALPPQERARVRFIHLNHTNPALWSDTKARRKVEELGFRVAEEGEQIDL